MQAFYLRFCKNGMFIWNINTVTRDLITNFSLVNSSLHCPFRQAPLFRRLRDIHFNPYP